MEVQEKNIIAAYEVADESGKALLKNLFPSVEFEKKPVTERIKTFEDAFNELGEDNFLVMQYCAYINADTGWIGGDEDLLAYLKLRIICAALNEGWEPEFTQDEERWYPWHWLYTENEIGDMATEEQHERCMTETGDYVTEYAGFAYSNTRDAPSRPNTNIGSRLCLKNRELAAYCGTQFVRLWADFKLIRKCEE
jgi:hypothetical protein